MRCVPEGKSLEIPLCESNVTINCCLRIYDKKYSSAPAGQADVYLNDLLRLDTSPTRWTDITGTLRGSLPSARSRPCVAAASNRLYVLGGDSDSRGKFFAMMYAGYNSRKCL